MTDKKITIKKSEPDPEPVELIAKSIVQIAEAFERIQKGPLKQNTVVLLLNDLTGVPKKQIHLILDCAPELKRVYTKMS